MVSFETWDALGVKETTARMEGEGITVAPWVKEMLSAGHTSFYQYQNDAALVYSPLDKKFVPVKKSDKTLRLADIKRRKAALEENESASLRHVGDGVLLLEFHSKMNTFDPDTFEIIEKAVERLCMVEPTVWWLAMKVNTSRRVPTRQSSALPLRLGSGMKLSA